MKIVDLDDSSDLSSSDTNNNQQLVEYNYNYYDNRQVVMVDAKRVLVGAGARILFYPTLLYNVCRNKMQAEFRWWDQIDQVWYCDCYLLCFAMFDDVESLCYCCGVIKSTQLNS